MIGKAVNCLKNFKITISIMSFVISFIDRVDRRIVLCLRNINQYSRNKMRNQQGGGTIFFMNLNNYFTVSFVCNHDILNLPNVGMATPLGFSSGTSPGCAIFCFDLAIHVLWLSTESLYFLISALFFCTWLQHQSCRTLIAVFFFLVFSASTCFRAYYRFILLMNVW